MTYPNLFDYQEAIQRPSENFRALTDLVYDESQYIPYIFNVGSSCVFKMKSKLTGKFYALKCFLGERALPENYRQISDLVNSIDSPYFVHIQYSEDELLVKRHNEYERYPVLIMDWVDGKKLVNFLKDNHNDRYTMDMLCFRFCKMAAWLRSQPFVHGDLSPDNIIVRPDGSLTLIDYDCLYSTSMKMRNECRCDGGLLVNPLLQVDKLGSNVDDFALACIALSLKVISLRPSWFRKSAFLDYLLFNADQYLCIENSKAVMALQELLVDDEVKRLYSLYLMACANISLDLCAPDMFLVEDPEYKYELLSTQVTDDDLANAVTDSFGVKYSKDGKRLLKANERMTDAYTIKEGTSVICDNAFSRCFLLSNLTIPKGVTTIGDRAFEGCGLRSVVIPCSVVRMGANPFVYCFAWQFIFSTDFKKEKSVLFDMEKKKIISADLDAEVYTIPDGVTTIGASSFEGNNELSYVKIPSSVTTIEECAFKECSSLKRIVIPSGVTTIDDYAFLLCESLTGVVLPDSVTSIGHGAFAGCDKLRPSIRKSILARYGKRVFKW